MPLLPGYGCEGKPEEESCGARPSRGPDAQALPVPRVLREVLPRGLARLAGEARERKLVAPRGVR